MSEPQAEPVGEAILAELREVAEIVVSDMNRDSHAFRGRPASHRDGDVDLQLSSLRSAIARLGKVVIALTEQGQRQRATERDGAEAR